MVRSIPAFIASDGSIHRTEREALVAELKAVLNGAANRNGVFSAAAIDAVVAAIPSLLPILGKLNDPRNTAPQQPRQRPEAPGSLLPTGEDNVPLQDEGDLLFIDEAVQAAPILPEVTWDDLRLGQKVEFMWSPNPAEEPEAAIAGIIVWLDGPIETIGGWAHIEHDAGTHIAAPTEIRQIIAQPEQLLPLDEARQLLAELEAKTPDMTTFEGRWDYTRRIMVAARVEQLEQEAKDVPTQND